MVSFSENSKNKAGSSGIFRFCEEEVKKLLTLVEFTNFAVAAGLALR